MSKFKKINKKITYTEIERSNRTPIISFHLSLPNQCDEAQCTLFNPSLTY